MNADDPEVKHVSEQISYVARNMGQHSGGLVIIPETYNINDFTPVQYVAGETGTALPASHYDFNSIHDRLLKMDFLGHSMPTLLAMMHRRSGVAPEEIPLNDPKVLSLFLSPKAMGLDEKDSLSAIGTAGIHEFSFMAIRKLIEEIRPKTVEDLIRVSGLHHGTDIWKDNVDVRIRNQTVSVWECPATRDDITNDLTQRGMPFDTAFTIAEFVRKGRWRFMKPELIKAMRDYGTPEWYIRACEKVKYLFPRAHAAAYVTDSLRLTWYKLYHPKAFYPVWFSVKDGNLDPTDFDMNITQLRKAILSIRMDLQDYDDKDDAFFSEEYAQKSEREATLLLLLEMKLRGCSHNE